MVNWLEVRAPPIRAVEHGIDAVDTFASTHTGPVSWDRIDYPVGEVMPQSTTRTDGNEFTHRLYANLYFEREKRQDYIDDILHPVAAVIDETMAALAATESVVAYVPQSIEDFAGELDNTLLLLVTIEFEVATLVDLSETGP